MDGIIINELSLSGQFHDSQDFWKNGMPPFYKALQDARSFGVGYLFKQGSFYGAQATPDKTLHDLLTAPEARIIDEAKRYKSTLARAICNPFWDDAPQQDLNAHYLADEADVSGSSVAEPRGGRPGCDAWRRRRHSGNSVAEPRRGRPRGASLAPIIPRSVFKRILWIPTVSHLCK